MADRKVLQERAEQSFPLWTGVWILPDMIFLDVRHYVQLPANVLTLISTQNAYHAKQDHAES